MTAEAWSAIANWLSTTAAVVTLWAFIHQTRTIVDQLAEQKRASRVSTSAAMQDSLNLLNASQNASPPLTDEALCITSVEPLL